MTIDPGRAMGGNGDPCLSCSEETAVGSVFYSDRHAVDLPGGERRYVCSLCYGRVRAKAIHEGISDERMVEVWTIMATGGWF